MKILRATLGTRLRSCLLLLLLFMLGGLGSQGVQAAPVVATILASKGTNQVQHAGKSSAIKVNSSLYLNDIVRAGANGKVTILFTDGSQVRLNSNAAVQITPPKTVANGRRSLFRVIGGEIWAGLRPNKAVQTASATLGVAGTEFNVVVTADQTTTLTVTEGVVDFSNQYGGVMVRASQQSVARLGFAPTQPVTIANPGLIVEWNLDLDIATIPHEKFFVALGGPTLVAQLASRAQKAAQSPNDAAAQRDFGDVLFDARRYDEALAAYQKSDAIAPQQVGTLIRLGLALQELNRRDEAQPYFERAVQIAPAGTPEHADALIGLGWFQLSGGEPANAEQSARAALAEAPTSAEANIVLGLALMRQRGREAEARAAFNAAIAGQPEQWHYQAYSWLGLIDLAENNRANALKNASTAVKMEPNSALARGNLALVYFFSGQSELAEREARRASELDPQSVAAKVVLGQALLAQGDVDNAARVAAQAVALDDELPQAHYLLGVADAARRDYVHAIRSLQRSLQLAPDFLPAASALARVYNRTGRPKEALALLTNLESKQSDNGSVVAALGEVYYEQARYPEAVAQYQRAQKLQPDSALIAAGLARVDLDANRLNESITAAQRAVSLAPDVAQFHAILGLAYTYSRLDTQAERSYRTALALDSKNALALVQLALSNQDGDIRTTKRTGGVAFAQGFLQDPAISSELLRGGVSTEITPRLGNKADGLTLVHRDVALQGDYHLYSRATRFGDSGDRDHADNREFNIRQDSTLVLGPRTNAYFHLFHRRDRNDLPGSLTQPVSDDTERFRFTQGIFALRHRLNARGTLYAGFFTNDQRDELDNPNRDLSSVLPGTGLFGIPIRVLNGTQSSRANNPEVRFDWQLGRTPSQARTLTLGAARLRTEIDFSRSLLVPGRPASPDNTGILNNQQSDHSTLTYANYSQRDDKLNFDVQLRVQKVNNDGTQTFVNTRPGGGGLGNVLFSNVLPPSKTYVLPSTVVSYQANRQTAFRLFASRRLTETTSSILAPAQTLLSTEGQTLPLGLPTTSNVAEFDIERQLGGNGLLKLFLFRSTADNLLLDGSSVFNSNALGAANVINRNSLLLNRVSRKGIGARLERQLGSRLFGQFGLVLSRTSYRDARGQTRDETPYQPGLIASSNLNYVSSSGNKVGVTLNYGSSFLQGSDSTSRFSRYPGRFSVDLLLSREPTVRQEIFFQVTNLFNSRQISFQDVPANARRFRLGIVNRF